MKTQKICSSILLIFLCFVSFFIGYTKSFSVPVFASAPSGYTPVTSDQELSQSFNDYCKSRDAEFTSSMPGATYTYIYNKLKEYAGLLGYNIDEMQENLYKSTDAGGGIMRWYMSSQLIGMYNEIFAMLINENELEVGDTADIAVYTGRYFSDDQGYNCFAFESNTSIYNSPFSVTKLGTPYLYNFDSYISSVPLNVTRSYNNVTYTITGERQIAQYQTNYLFAIDGGNSDAIIIYLPSSDSYSYKSYPAICFNTRNNTYYLGYYNYYQSGNVSRFYNKKPLSNVNANNSGNITINFTTIDNRTINNNIHEGDTIITNEGDVIEGDTTINYNPYPNGGGSSTGSGTTGGSGTDGTINFPDINFSLPDINWSLGDLSQKFPFSIPFDLISFFTLINAEPEAPRIDAEIPLGSWYTWEFEADFGQFENYASIVRNVEFIGFCVGLIYITIRLVKG